MSTRGAVQEEKTTFWKWHSVKAVRIRERVGGRIFVYGIAKKIHKTSTIRLILVKSPNRRSKIRSILRRL